MDTKPTYTGQPEVKKQPNTALKIIVLIMLIALLIVGILLPIKLVPNAVTSLKTKFTSLFSNSAPTTNVILSTNKNTITSGDTFVLLWNGEHRKDGSYVLSYECKIGVTLSTSFVTANEAIACNTPYYFSPADNTIGLGIVSTHNQIVPVLVTLGFLSHNSLDVETISKINIPVNPSTKQPIKTATSTPVKVVPVKATSTPAVTHTSQTSNPNGTADLSIRIIDVGYLTDDAVFVPSASITSSQRGAVKFTVTNIGNKNTGLWSFKAHLPTSANPIYSAQVQNSLRPQDGIIYTLAFEPVNYTRVNTVTIIADYVGMIKEVSESNNTASATIINSDF